MEFFTKRLQYYLGVVVIMSIAVPALITGALVTRQNYYKNVEFGAKIRAQNFLDVLQGGVSLSLWSFDPDLVLPIIESVQLDESVLAIRITNTNNEVFVDYHRWPKEIIEHEKDKVVFSAPVHYDGAQVGDVELHYGLKNTMSRAKDEAVTLAQMLLFQLFITFVMLSLVLNIKILKPLKRLSSAAKGIASGDLKTRIDLSSQDEFGELSKQLESMRSSLERHVTLLELRVDQRTRDQQKLNEALQESVDQVQKAQTQLVQQEKLAALGGLVAGIAHELNTPVGNALTVATSINTHAESVKGKMSSGITRSALESFIDDVEEGSKMIEYNLTRAAELVAGFKQTAIDQTSAKRREFDLAQLIGETILALTPNLKNKLFQIVTSINPDVILDSYPGPLSQIITNLINNAVLHAFEGRETGVISIACDEYQKNCQSWILLTVKDNGKGIPDDNQKRIFDPFFTTKLGKGGNGLGMHIVHNLVTGALGGGISVQSELEVGTEFFIDLPCLAPKLQQADDSL